MSERLRFHPGLTSLAAFGLRSSDEVYAGEVPWKGAEVQRAEDGYVELSFPLPGTPDDRGRLTGRPHDAGTGRVVLRRWSRAPWPQLLFSRLTHPRSSSLAEREWNLLCHLRAHGVGTLQPLAVGARGRGPVSRHSFLVTRGAEGLVPLPEWLDEGRSAADRRRGIQALGAFLAHLFEARVLFPRLTAEQLWMAPPDAGEDPSTCENHDLGFAPNRMPSVILGASPGGRILPSFGAAQMRAVLTRLAAGGPASRLSNRERLRVLRIATRRWLDVEERRRLALRG